MSIKLRIWRVVFAVMLGAVTTAGLAADTNAIKQVQVRRDGDAVLVKVELWKDLKTPPTSWTVVDPARIVIDFPDTENQTGSSVQPANVGDLKSVNVVQSEKMTRLVLNLFRSVKHTSELVGNSLMVRLEQAAGDQSKAPVAATTGEKSGMATPLLPAIRDILFRRGEDGQGLVMLELTDSRVQIDVRREGNGLTVDLPETEVPQRLQNRRDVNDFATPVSTITARAMGNATRLEISAKGKWFHQAQLANNQLTLEIKPVPSEDANKLVPTGQQGQKVSINFFEAESTMVLRTLAEISGKNVMIEPSLAGRRITANLENIPYDQALDIVMTQANASMRIRNDVILFGDRAALLKRDQEAAEEVVRASDTAPLISETFELNYLKVADVVSLINSNIASGGGAGAAAAPAAGQAAQPAGQAGQGQRPRGMLSVRGSMTSHEATNKLFVRDTAGVIDAIRDIVRKVDIPPRQVLIEARIVQAGTNFGRDLGLKIGFNDLSNTAGRGYGDRILGSNAFATVAGSQAAAMGLTGQSTGGGTSAAASATVPTAPVNLINLPRSATGYGQLAVSIFDAKLTRFINLELQASEDEGKSKSVSTPRVVTVNNKAAAITYQQTINIPQGVSPTTGLPIYKTVSAPLSLSVTPAINPGNFVSLDLKIAKSELTDRTTGNVESNDISTNVIVENGGTVVLGGILQESETEAESRVPFLADLPVVGNLFRNSGISKKRTELLVFITPRVLDNSLSQSVNR